MKYVQSYDQRRKERDRVQQTNVGAHPESYLFYAFKKWMEVILGTAWIFPPLN